MSGAIDFDECFGRKVRTSHGNPGRCSCGVCAICGQMKHTAVHGPIAGQPPGTKPYDHEYEPRSASPAKE